MLIHRLLQHALRAPLDSEGAAGGSAAPEGAGAAPSEGAAAPGESGAGLPPPEGGEGAGTGEEAEETVVMFGEEALPPAESAPAWVKQLRQRFRDVSNENARLRGGAPAAPAAEAGLPPAPGAKPKIIDPDIDYDTDKFAVALEKWHEASRKRDEAERKARDAQEQDQRTWKQTVEAYQSAGAKLGFSDYEDCEAAAMAALSPTQQAIIVQGAESAEKAALIMYSLGRNMKLLQDVSGVSDPVKFAFQIADIQRKLVVTKRKPSTKPESTLPASGVSASAALAGEDKKQAELREEAARTGDMTKLLNYNRTRREAANKRRA